MAAWRRSARAAGVAVRIALTVAAGLAVACDRGPGAPYACACTFVTDYDADVRYDVEICAPPGAEVAAQQARGCAQSGAPGTVRACSCRPIGDLGACDVGACRAVPR